MHTNRLLAGALMSAGLAAAGVGLGSGAAPALPSEPHQWCPGDSMHSPAGPGAVYVWDMNVCHTWQYVQPGMGNVPVSSPKGVTPADGFEISLEGSNLWDGPNPPPGSAIECGTGLFGGPIRC
ncbi:hypothetical protein [Mycolicibacterium sp. 120270]|uniref:hypothetical protein n=1 Tax=Mycolicibacterium sp. 120270 TaxID=3090600 RepID=UPI00299D169B|nr:hypothetical protein [Mycolicibacterium sp. 120270]MDX1887582.1 hypothetical protein [Mycolicibacterium sp. 120270]